MSHHLYFKVKKFSKRDLRAMAKALFRTGLPNVTKWGAWKENFSVQYERERVKRELDTHGIKYTETVNDQGQLQLVITLS